MIPVLLQSESPWQRNDAIPFYFSLFLCTREIALGDRESEEVYKIAFSCFVTVFARNLVHAYKFRIIQKTAREFFYTLDNLEFNRQ